MAEHLQVMISSTARDLPEHRREAMDACLRQGMFPIMMEHLPSSDEEAVPASLKMVNDADIYVLILAHRYGYVPDANNPTRISVTEHEYNRAVERKIPILTFAMHEDHPLKAADVEKGEGAVKLDAFKQRALLKVTNFFKSPADLRADVIDSLSDHRHRDVTTFHYVSEIPTPPGEFIAHPYTLLQTNNLIGRKKELKVLTDWITGKELVFDGERVAPDSVRVMSVVAIGGMGKSALTWKWFNDVAPQEMKNLEGRMWWSFYESDATFENFVIRALAYVSKRSIDEVTKIPAPDRETELLGALDHRPFLFVLDGLERILIAYARMDAARLDDSEVGKEKNLRKTADPRVGSFLKKLEQVKQSRILVSSRLYPAELETVDGSPIKGTFRISIGGLTDEDAVELWRASGVSGSSEELLPVFSTFGKHPLLIQALAGEVKRYRKAPGNFEKWRKANQKFDPGKFASTKEAMGHVLEFALRGLGESSQRVLQTIAAFRMPTSYDTLAAILIGENKPCANEPELDAVLRDLEDRGLVGWDKRANRYDLHPIVRGVVWSTLREDVRQSVYTNLHAYFDAVSDVDDRKKVKSLEDLTPAIELYNTLIGLGRNADAMRIFMQHLFDPMMFRLGASYKIVELLEMLCPCGPSDFPNFENSFMTRFFLHGLGLGYHFSGAPEMAAQLYQEINKTLRYEHQDVITNFGNLANALRVSGALVQSEIAARSGVALARRELKGGEGFSLMWLGWTLAARGRTHDAENALKRALIEFSRRVYERGRFESPTNSLLAQRALWMRKYPVAFEHANRAWDLAHIRNQERDFVRAARVQGEAALKLGNFSLADERLHHAVARARTIAFIEEELAALIALAELYRKRQKGLKSSRECLVAIWDFAERGPFPISHTDGLNVLVQIERHEGNTIAAIEAATKAYQLAWCDGPPFAYHWGLEKAKQHLKELGAPEPELPPFDESKFEPMPEVEINPKDEFYVDEASLDNH